MELLWSVYSLVTQALFALFVCVIALAKRWDSGLNTEARIEARPCHVIVGTWTSVTIARTVREEAKSPYSVPGDCLSSRRRWWCCLWDEAHRNLGFRWEYHGGVHPRTGRPLAYNEAVYLRRHVLRLGWKWSVAMAFRDLTTTVSSYGDQRRGNVISAWESRDCLATEAASSLASLTSVQGQDPIPTSTSDSSFDGWTSPREKHSLDDTAPMTALTPRKLNGSHAAGRYELSLLSLRVTGAMPPWGGSSWMALTWNRFYKQWSFASVTKGRTSLTAVPLTRVTRISGMPWRVFNRHCILFSKLLFIFYLL
jgi:hypothetical protein